MSESDPFSQVLLVEKDKDQYEVSEITPKVPCKFTLLFIKTVGDKEPTMFRPSNIKRSDLEIVLNAIEGTTLSDISKKRKHWLLVETEKKTEEVFTEEEHKLRKNSRKNSPIFDIGDTPETFQRKLKIAFEQNDPTNTYTINLKNPSTSSPTNLLTAHRIFHVEESKEKTYNVSVSYETDSGNPRKNWTSIHIQPENEKSRWGSSFSNTQLKNLRNAVVDRFLTEKKS